MTDIPDDARFIADKPDGEFEYDPDRDEWVPQAGPDLSPYELRELMKPVTKRHLRLTLVRNGISLAQVEAAIASMPDGLAKQEAEIEWQDASEFGRLHPTLLLVAEALGLSPEKVDQMWEQAVSA